MHKVLGKLPDLFTFDHGQKVTSIADWRERRRELIRSCVEMQYGDVLPKPEFLEAEPLITPRIPGWASVWKVKTGTYTKPVTFTIYAYIPEGDGPWPTVIDGDLCWDACHFSGVLHAEIIQKFVSRGIMFVAFNRCELAPDVRNPRRTGNLYETYGDHEFGAIAAWAWGFSRTLDALIKLGLADTSCITFTGLSRGGKAALLAGALDERATIVNPEGSGTSGAGCYRIYAETTQEDGTADHAETLKEIYQNFPDWLCRRLEPYLEAEAELPFDQHFLKALVAPRVLFCSEALSDAHAGPVNTYQSSVAAREAWKLYGKPENVLWYWRPGVHAHLPEDMDMLIEVIEREWKGKPLQSEQFMKLPFDPPEKIYDWCCPDV